jgi:DNA-binding XRE family transcriptional regulator
MLSFVKTQSVALAVFFLVAYTADMKAEWFGGRLRELRAAAGMDRQQLADAAGMKAGGIRDIEQGRRLPGWETVVALCVALG